MKSDLFGLLSPDNELCCMPKDANNLRLLGESCITDAMCEQPAALCGDDSRCSFRAEKLKFDQIFEQANTTQNKIISKRLKNSEKRNLVTINRNVYCPAYGYVYNSYLYFCPGLRLNQTKAYVTG